MTFLATSPLAVRLLGWTTLILSLAPWSIHASTLNVQVNGTTFIGMSQKFSSNVTIEFFGGEFLS